MATPTTAQPATNSLPATNGDSTQDAAELTAMVDDLLEKLQTKFSTVSTEIFGKIEAMSKRLDEMEKGIKEGK
ncbi:heat shock factor binding protein 1-domain-containing protein [Pyronema domesticum]|nr:heat shock factor binding protein 1-domain-containing protein [Pyronema domesticum]